MKLDKKTLYRHIVMLQAFRCCYTCYLNHRFDGTQIYEVRKLYKDETGNMHKFISFALSNEGLPTFLDVVPIINYDVTLLNENAINNYVNQCKSYGIQL